MRRGWAFGRFGAVGTCCAGALLGAMGAAAQQEDPIAIRLDTAVQWDTNVFRLPEGAPDPQAALGRPGKSDRFARTTLGFRLDKAYAQQRFVVDLAQTATRYEKFTSLDRDFANHRAAWNWALTPRLNGTLSVERSQSEIQFEDARGAQLVVATTKNRAISADAWLFGGWHLIGGLAENERRNSAPFVSLPDSRTTGLELGVRYVARSSSSFTATVRSREGTLAGDPALFASGGFSEREHEIAGVWLVTGRSTLNGRLTWISRRHDAVPQRDFSGTAGELRYAWNPTGRLSVGVTATRTFQPFFAGTASSFRTEDTLSVSPAWRVSEKITLRMTAVRRSTEYLGALVPTAGDPRRDLVRSVEFGANWMPHRRIALGASLRHDRRSSSDAAFSFDNTVANVNASVRF